MKKSILAVAIATLALVSCNKTDNQITPEPSQTGTELAISFDRLGGEFNTRTGEQPTTRAFFDNVAAAEPWEKIISKVLILVCNSEGRLVMRKTFDDSEIASLSAKIILPAECVGTECTFYAAANLSITGTTSATTSTTIESYRVDPSMYNFSSFDFANSEDAMSSGMIMSDHKKIVIQPKSTPMNLSFLLRRPVAKVASKIFIDPSFSAKYGGGAIRVNKAEIINSNKLAPIWNIGYTFNGTGRFSAMQFSKLQADGSFANLFYVAESPAVSADEQVILRIDATFDQDGNFTTTDDHISLNWDVKLDGSGSGEIRRNAYYRVQATITGMNSIDGIKSIIVADEWETPSTQDVISLDGNNQNQ